MKLLLDENLPKKLKQEFTDHEVYTVRDQGWQGKKNGELMDLMIENQFNVLLTFDKNLRYQQNFKRYMLPVLLLNAEDNAYLTLVNLVPRIKELLTQNLAPGVTVVK